MANKNNDLKKYFQWLIAKSKWKNPKMIEGCKKSKRVLTPEQAREMVRKREEKRRGK